MRVPIRKGCGPKPPLQDPKMTQEKYTELKNKLNFWIKIKRPRDASEVRRLAEMGDFSENVGYQMAKGRLRGLNQRIDDLQNLINKAEIIVINNSGIVKIGNRVVIQCNDREKTYTILGSTESDPTNGIISHTSPLGSALLNKKINDIFSLTINGKEKEYKIIKII